MADPKHEAEQDEGPSAFERFENFARKLIAVPKREIDEQEDPPS